jgi:adenine-specific DNA-methyltransferase
MAKIDITKTELVWPGKYNEVGTLNEVARVALPFQIIETVNESRATREAKKSGIQSGLFDVYEGKEGDTFEAGWRNKLIWGDNLLVMDSLMEKFAGKIDLICIDPPFAIGTDFSFTALIGDSGENIFKEQSAIEEKAYRDTWANGMEGYLQMLFDRLLRMRELLSENGSICVHVGPNVSQYVRVLLDGVFGGNNFVTEIIWKRTTAHFTAVRFAFVHDVIYQFSKSDGFVFNKPEIAHGDEYLDVKYKNQDLKGQYRLSDASGAGQGPPRVFSGKRIPPPTGRHWPSQEYIDEHADEYVLGTDGMPQKKSYLKGATVGSVWIDIPPVNSQAAERLGYDTQKPEPLLERIIASTSNPGDLVADFFCGSGTALAVAEKLGRRWIGCDLGRWAVHVTRKRLLSIDDCKPFEVLNLGKYERQYWQGVTFGKAKNKPFTEQPLYEYLAFILKLYGAQPMAGMANLHGKKGKAMIHIGAVDAPVTIAEIDAAVDECAQLKQSELHILGWEWEMGLYDLMVEAAKKKRVKLMLLLIPHEVMEWQAGDKGDVRFFELAYLEAEIKQPKKLTAQVLLKDFVIPNTELIPEDVRSKVKKWSDYMDYWGVDWDFRNDTFMQGWVAYRTRNERKLALMSDSHSYDKAGKYRILVKVIDVFGNDTSQAFDVEVK